MESKIVALILIALLGGLAIGYGLEYTSAASTTRDVKVTNFPSLPTLWNANVTNFPRPTTSVNVTNLAHANATIAKHVTEVALAVGSVYVGSGGFYTSPVVNVDGFSKVTICLNTTGIAPFGYLLKTGTQSLGMIFPVDTFTGYSSFVKTYEVPNQLIQFTFNNTGVTNGYISVSIYLMA